ncbi:MAG TPA: hypothetical protein VH372_03325 [Actinospica sp.]|nr:hypothetical protein [Actinospica sp.]
MALTSDHNGETLSATTAEDDTAAHPAVTESCHPHTSPGVGDRGRGTPRRGCVCLAAAAFGHLLGQVITVEGGQSLT